MTFSTRFKKWHGVSFFAARMVNIFEEMVLSDFQTGNSAQACEEYIWVTKVLHQFPDILNIIEDVDGEETGARMLGISHADDGTLFTSCIEEEPLLVRAVC